jgi:hypothetical protein
MIGYLQLPDDKDKRAKEYRCSVCGTLIALSADLVKINGTDTHSFVNPSGIRCNFRSFVHCENVLVDERLFLEYSWFPGYGWRFLICGSCSRHLGWKYDLVNQGMQPQEFFGLLTQAVDEVAPEST